MNDILEAPVAPVRPVDRDWRAFYADHVLRGWQIPGFANSNPDEGVYRHPRLVLGSLPVGDKARENPPFDVICADVLRIDTPVTLTRQTHIYARLIEVVGGGALQIDQIDDADFDVNIVTQAIVTGGSRQTSLPLSVFRIGEDGAPTVTESELGVMVPHAAGFKVAAGSDEAVPAPPNVLADLFLSRGQDLPVLLNTQFLIASLLFTEDAALARGMLGWIDGVLMGDDTFSDLAMQARGLLSTVVNLSTLPEGAVLVPTLDHDIYADSARLCQELLQQRQNRYLQLVEKTANDRNWAEDAETALADKRNEAELYFNLQKQAEDARQHAETARAKAAQSVYSQLVYLDKAQASFETGIVQWQRSETQKEAIKIVTGAVGLLADLPALVTGSPAALKSGTAILQTGLDLAVKAPDIVRRVGSKAGTAVEKKYGSLKTWMTGAPAPRPGGDDDDDLGIAGLFEPDLDDLMDEFEKIDDGPDDAEYLTWRRQQKDMKKYRDGVEAERKAKTEKFTAAAKSAAGHSKEIVDAALRIADLAEQAAKMEERSSKLLDQVNAGVKVALGGADLRGIDVATGGQQAWDKLNLAIERMFKEEQGGVMLEIKGGSDYRNEMRTLMIDGRAMCMALLALAKANSDLAEAKLRRRAAEEAVALFRKRLAEREARVLTDELYQQAALGRVIEAKRSVFLALETYRRAFAYFTLLPDSRLPELPRITMSLEDFARQVRTVTGRKIAAETIATLYNGPPSTLNGVEIMIAGDKLNAIRDSGGEVSLTILPDHPQFASYHRVRIHSIRVYFDGVGEGTDVSVWIRTSGIYRDRPKQVALPSSSYVTQPEEKRFIYNPGRPEPIAKADIAPRYANDFFLPTPFTTWKFGLGSGPASRAVQSEELANLKAVRVQFFGEFCA
jgi:hypothetical protein